MQTDLLKMEQELRRELQRTLPRVGLNDELLERYRYTLRGHRKFARLSYYLVVALLFAAEPVFGPALLGVPPDLGGLVESLGLGVIVPLCLVAAFIDLTPLPRRITSTVHTIVIPAFWFALLLMQRASRAEQFYFPPEVLGIAMLCAAMLCGFNMRRMLVAITLFTALDILSEWHSRSPAQVFFMDVLLIAVLGVAAAAGAFFMEVLQRRLWLAGELAKVVARTDHLTGLMTRAEFNHRFAEVLATAERQRRPVAVMLIDLDNFKSINDRCGHIYGDDVLRRVGAAILDTARRPLDIQARYGGEEMVIVWYDCGEAAASTLASQVLQAVRGTELPAPTTGAAPKLTLSAGVVVLVPDLATRPWDTLRAADDLMYEAKRSGKDRYLLKSPRPAATLAPALAGG
ncbi:MAG: GGDEF domain-containing protein [Nevskia sp.]|nr:GGDEF domain-containing protein [Nevskia sp.]